MLGSCPTEDLRIVFSDCSGKEHLHRWFKAVVMSFAGLFAPSNDGVAAPAVSIRYK